MRTPLRAVGEHAHLYLSLSSGGAIATQVPASYLPASADAVRIRSANGEIEHPTKDREDVRGHAAQGDDFITLHKKCRLSFSGYAIPSGTIQTAPDVSTVLKSFCDESDPSASTTIAASPASTASTWQVADASGVSAGDVVIAAYGSEYIAAEVITSDASTPGVLTVWPPAPGAMSASATVKTAIAYSPSNDRDATEKSLSGFVGNNGAQARFESLVPTKATFSLGGADAGSMSIEATGREAHRAVRCALDGSLSSGATTATVTSGNAIPDNVSSSKPFYMTIEADGTNAEEVVRVTDKSGADLTIVRAQASTSDVDHLDGAVLRPYFPAATVAGTPISSILGSVCVGQFGDSARTEYQMKSASLELDLPIVEKNDAIGVEWSFQGYADKKRLAKVAVDGWSDSPTLLLARLAEDLTTSAVCVQQGDVEGQIFGFIAKKVLFDNPADDYTAEEMAVSLSGRAVVDSPDDETATQIEIRFFFG